ncbi:MAG: hypothetical protein RR838_08610 [Clostridium sp.]
MQHELNLNISYCQTISIETTDSNKVFLVCTSSNAGLCKLLNVANDTITVLASNSLGGSFGYGVMQTKIGNNTHFIVGVYRLNTSSPGYLYGAFATISGNDFTLTSISNSIAVNSSGFHITEDYSAVTLDTNKVAITVRTTSSQQTVWVYRLDPGNNSAQAISLTIPTLLLDSCLSRHNGNTFVLSCFNGANTGGIDCYVIEENTSMLNIKHSRRITAYDTSNISQCNIINLTLLTYVNSSDSDFTYSCTIDAAPKVTKALTQANIKGVAMSVGSAGDTIEINTL